MNALLATTDADLSGLLDGVLEKPEDDGVRLVYADRLDDLGQPERASFIRVQCELARLERDPDERRKLDPKKGVFAVPGGGGLSLGFKPTSAMAARDALREREHELLLAHVNRLVWHPPGAQMMSSVKRFPTIHVQYLSPFGLACDQDLSRGFVERVELPTEAFLRHAAALFAAQPVTRVVLADREPNDYGPPEDDIRFGWLSEHEHGPGPAGLPRELLKALAEVRKGKSCRYPSRAAALDALSFAAVSWGRAHAAGLTHRGGCPKCEGRGRVRQDDEDREGTPRYNTKPCPSCRGTGLADLPGLPPWPARSAPDA